ncbi:Glycoside hydrolase [Mycena sanguinolenta]|uniref:Glycoside hydrolase n=1 Tax=Mycena sanguinolenta TaxID=230812 RepID=A0A8H6Z4Q6_9AGAR|nr:Glycoside hydrolase [Mycena sanguinolenta]
MSQLPSLPPNAGDALDIPFPLSTTVGALELGVLVAIFLSGVLTVQLYIYFDRFPKDPTSLKVMVALVWILDFGHTLALGHFIYTITVVQYGQPALLAIPPKSLDVSILLSGFIGPLEQGWFTYRLYRFTKTLPLPVICAGLSLLRLGGSTALFAYTLKEPTIQEYATHLNWLIEAVVIVGAAVDAILATALCYYLSFWRTGFRRTNKLLNQLMTWTIETGAVTTTGALALLLTFLTMKDNCAASTYESYSDQVEQILVVYLGLFCLMAKLFSNSLLFSLNARERFARICAEVISVAGFELGHEAVNLVSPCSPVAVLQGKKMAAAPSSTHPHH